MKVSIVTPSFNQLSWLRLCVASVSDQTGIEHEHIVQDAGSNAEFGAWARSTPNLHIFVERDDGMYDAVNRGLQRATGEICAFLNCDEQYLPGTLAKVATFFKTHPEIDVLFGDTILVDENCQPFSYRRAVLPSLRHVRRAHLNTSSCSTFFRRRLLDRGFYFDPSWKDIGDAVWMEDLLRNKLRMAVLREPLATFAFTGQNRSTLSVASKELASRTEASNPKSWIAQKLAITAHRIRKALAGAYLPRKLAIDVFTPTSPDRRDRRVAWAGFHWPQP